MSCPIRAATDRRALAALLLAALTLGACGTQAEEASVIDWDLSRSHTVEDVGWPTETSAASIEPVDSVRIRLPGGRVVQAGDEVHDVTMDRSGDLVSSIKVDFDPLGTEDAYRVAMSLVEEWGLPREPIEEWHDARAAGRASGSEDLTSTALSTAESGARTGPGGPVPSLQLRYSFVDERPTIVSLQFFWPGDTPAG